jgi:hypothetical protein
VLLSAYENLMHITHHCHIRSVGRLLMIFISRLIIIILRRIQLEKVFDINRKRIASKRTAKSFHVYFVCSEFITFSFVCCIETARFFSNVNLCSSSRLSLLLHRSQNMVSKLILYNVSMRAPLTRISIVLFVLSLEKR